MEVADRPDVRHHEVADRPPVRGPGVAEHREVVVEPVATPSSNMVDGQAHSGEGSIRKRIVCGQPAQGVGRL